MKKLSLQPTLRWFCVISCILLPLLYAPIQVNAVRDLSQVKIRVVDYAFKRVCYGALACYGYDYIYIQKGLPDIVFKYALYHELAHFLLDGTDANINTDHSANIFAFYLLNIPVNQIDLQLVFRAMLENNKPTL